MHTRGGINAVVLLTIGLPLFAIVASVGTAVVAVTSGDPPLPDQYHWEGDKLDHDFQGSQRAAALGLQARLELQPVAGRCHLSLGLKADLPPALDVSLVHGSRPELDRQLRFLRSGNSSTYVAPCPTIPPGQWHIELQDPNGGWTFRQEWSGTTSAIAMSAIGR
jgi:uncharacterized protein